MIAEPDSLRTAMPMLVRKLLIAAAIFPIAAAAALAAIPTSRHFASAVLHDPENLPTAPGERVHVSAGAEDCARALDALLDKAIADVEKGQRAPFVNRPIVAAFVDDVSYAAANGAGATFPAGVTFRGRVAISPRVCGPERTRLKAVLTHELSHAHLQQHRSALGYIDLPIWFLEGLAVSVSGGGGAEKASPELARERISSGRVIAINDSGTILNLVGLHFVRPEDAREPDSVYMAYRQASLFVQSLRENDAAFVSLMDALLAGGGFADSFSRAYSMPPHEAWARFARAPG